MKKQVRQKYIWHVLVILFVALILRLFYILEFKSTPFFSALGCDPLRYHEWAKELLKGNFTNEFSQYGGPLYPFFLGVIYKIFGVNLLYPRIVQALLGTMTVFLVFYLGWKNFNLNVGLLAGLLAALYKVFFYFEGLLLVATLNMFLYLALTAVLTDYLAAPRWVKIGLAGFILGLCLEARANALLFFPLLIVTVLVRLLKKKEGGKVIAGHLVLFTACFFLVTVPFTLINYYSSGTLRLLPQHGGIALYLGVVPPQHEEFKAPLLGKLPEVEHEYFRREASRLSGKNLDLAGSSRFWRTAAVQFVKKHPLDFLKRMGLNFLKFLNAYEIPDNYNYYFLQRYSRLLKLPLPHFGVIFPLGIIGLFLYFKDWKKYYVLYAFTVLYTLITLPFLPVARRRLLVVPYLIIFAAAAIQWIYARIRENNYPTLVQLGIALFAFGFLGNIHLEGNDRMNLCQEYNALGIIYRRSGEMEKALEYFEKARKVNPNYPLTYYHMGNIYMDTGELIQAERNYKKVIEISPAFPWAYNNLGAVDLKLGKLSEAEENFRQAIKLDPYFVEARTNLVIFLIDQKRNDDALRAAEDFTSFIPDHPEGYYLTGLCNLLKNNYSASIENFNRALKLKPGELKVYRSLGKAYSMLGNWESVIEALEKYIALDDRDVSVLTDLGVAYAVTHDFSRARQCFNQILQLDPGNKKARMYQEVLRQEEEEKKSE